MDRSQLPRGKYFLTRDPGFYKMFFRLLLVMTLQQLATLAVNLVDNIMLGRYSELSMSGATLVNQVHFILQMVVSGVGAGVSVLGSQYWGKQQTGPIRRIISVGVKFALSFGLVFCLVGRFAPEAVVGIYTDDAAVIAEGASYLRVICWTYLIFSLSFTLMYSLQCVETAFVGTVMSVSTIFVNAALNYCLIYGRLGFPELGVRGAAIATLASRCVELAIILIYILFFDKKLKMKPRDIFGFDGGYLKDFLHTALPPVVTGFLWGVGMSAETAVLGHLTATVIAANAIATVVSQIFRAMGNASNTAAGVTMGKTVGQGRFDAIRPYARTLQIIFLCIGLLTGAALFFSRDALISIYDASPETAALASGFLLILSVTMVGTCYEFPVETGIIGGGGSPRYAALCDNLFMWLFTIPVSALAAFVWDAPAVVVFCLLKADQILKCIPNAIVCNRYRWVRVLTRE